HGEEGDLAREQALERFRHGRPSLDGWGWAGKGIARRGGPSRAKPRRHDTRGLVRRWDRAVSSSISAMSISRAAPLRRPDARPIVRLAARRVLLPRDERAP